MKKIFILSFAVVLFIPLVYLVASSAVNVLVWDEWDYYRIFFNHLNFWGIFDYQHGHHRMGIGGLVMGLVNVLTHWDMSVMSIVTTFGVFLSALLMLLISRIENKVFTFSDICIPLCVLTLTQLETAVGNVSLVQVVIPSVLMLFYAVLWRMPLSITKSISLGLVQFLMLFSGYGVTFFPVTVALIVAGIVRPNKLMTYKPAIFLLLSSAVSSAVYFYGLKFQCYTPYIHFNFIGMIRYFLDFGALLSGFKGFIGNIVGAGFILALGFVCIKSLIGIFRGSENSVVPFLISASVLSYMLNSAIGRTAIASRYMTVTSLGFALLYMVSRKNILVTLTISALAFHGSFVTWQNRSTNRVILNAERCQKFIDCYIETDNAASCNSLYAVYPRPVQTKMEQKILFMKENRLSFFQDYPNMEARP